MPDLLTRLSERLHEKTHTISIAKGIRKRRLGHVQRITSNGTPSVYLNINRKEDLKYHGFAQRNWRRTGRCGENL